MTATTFFYVMDRLKEIRHLFAFHCKELSSKKVLVITKDKKNFSFKLICMFSLKLGGLNVIYNVVTSVLAIPLRLLNEKYKLRIYIKTPQEIERLQGRTSLHTHWVLKDCDLPPLTLLQRKKVANMLANGKVYFTKAENALKERFEVVSMESAQERYMEE